MYEVVATVFLNKNLTLFLLLFSFVISDYFRIFCAWNQKWIESSTATSHIFAGLACEKNPKYKVKLREK